MKVLNYGSLNVDYVYSVDHIIVGGETQHSSKLEVFSGGKGLETSLLHWRRLGCRFIMRESWEQMEIFCWMLVRKLE